MLLESELIPFSVSPPIGEKVLVIAPHPDDETLGCGGTIRLLVEAEKKVRTIFLTSGDKAEEAEHARDYSLMREREAEKALKVLGVTDYDFFRFPDRELLDNYEAVYDKIEHAIESFMPDAVYCPSMTEINPDHRATAMMMMDIQRSRGSRGNKPDNIIIVFYEITTPLRPNLLIDITRVFGKKRKAMKRYRSQLRILDYCHYMSALNMFRSLTVNGPRFTEAFWVMDKSHDEQAVREWLSFGMRMHCPAGGTSDVCEDG